MKAPLNSRALCLIALFTLLAPCLLRAQFVEGTWSGQVVDIRTGMPIEGYSLKAGVNGRVDPFDGYHGITDSNGFFSISWDVESWENWSHQFRDGHFLRTRFGKGDYPKYDFYRNVYYQDDYLPIDFVREFPARGMLIRAIPRCAWIEGRALSAETGKPLADISISVLAVGRVILSTTSDANGRFEFPEPLPAFAWDPISGEPSRYYDIFPSTFRLDLEPRGFDSTPASLAIRAGDSSRFADILPPVVDGKWSKPLPLLSSRTNDIRTFCTLRVPEAGKQVPRNAVSAQILHGGEVPGLLKQNVKFRIKKRWKFQKGKKVRLKASSSSGLRVSFRSSNAQVLKVKRNRGFMQGRGRVVVTAFQRGNADWSESNEVRRKLRLR